MGADQAKETCKRVRAARIAAGHTQAQMADLLEVHINTYKAYEKETIPYRQIQQIADITGTSLRWLLRGEVDDSEVLQRLVELLVELSHKLEEGFARIEERLGRIEAGQLPRQERDKARHSRPTTVLENS